MSPKPTVENTVMVKYKPSVCVSRMSKLLSDIADKEKTRAEARKIAKVSLLVARHIMVASHTAAQKVDELELLYDDADFL